MTMHEIFDINKNKEVKQKTKIKAKIVNRLLNNKSIIFGIAIYVLLSILYTTLIIISNLINLF